MKMKLIYAGIRVRDYERSKRFYTEGLGLEVLKEGTSENTGGKWATLRSPDGKTALEINWYPAGEHATPYANGSELDHLGVSAEDIDAAVAHLQTHGAKVVLDRRPAAKEVFVTDPDGIWIELLGK